MDDSCAVCAETLDWVAYGPCGHREVCSTCVVRLRFVCEDRRCCLCKSESNTIFVTKALGDYTRLINDFSILPADPTEGQVGPYWYHEGTQGYFDDRDHYTMIKAMCKLSCSVCDKSDGQENGRSKRRGEFRNIEELKSHLFHQHRLLFCILCLEGSKKFICEQKLYTKAQLDQHIKKGDSKVDGSKSERGGFMGHPICDFCQYPFYGENELYSHMSTEHYTCHICQRQHPGEHVYYGNYDELESHFRQHHFLCEDEACLAKKFVVFTSESELKRHNAKEHGGHMSRSKRNAALQIPTGFQFRRSNEQDRRARGRGSHPDSSDVQLSMAIQASLETANAESSRDTSSSAQAASDHQETSEIGQIVNPFESLAAIDSEPYSIYRQVLGQRSSNTPLAESSFPPLPMASSSHQRKSRKNSERLGGNTMADRLSRKNKLTVLYSAKPGPAVSNRPPLSASSSSQLKPTLGYGSPSYSQSRPATVDEPVQSGAGSALSRPRTVHGFVSANSASSSRNSGSTTKIGHSASSPNLVGAGSLDPSISNFPPVSASQNKKVPTRNQPLLKVEDVKNANKSLVEKIRAALEFDEDKFAAFKEITSEYRQGVIGSGEYLAYVHQFELSHLVLELARLCPDAHKQKELLEIYNFNTRSSGSYGNNLSNGNKKGSRKGKEKCEDAGISGSKDALADSIISSVRNLQSDYKPLENMEVLLKNGYRPAKGKSKISGIDQQTDPNSADSLLAASSQTNSQSDGGGSKKDIVSKKGGNKQQKKTPKFLRVRLGDASAEAHSDVGNSASSPDLSKEKANESKGLSDGLPVHGVWRNGGGRKLVALTGRGRPK